MSAPVYFLTWTTYGTWLHGDRRGSVDREHNTPGTPWLTPDPARAQRMAARLRAEPFIMSDPMRAIVDEAIRDHADHRGWRIHALNVRSNHVHVVVESAVTHSPESTMQQFKSWGTRRLIAAGLATSATRVWTHHGSTRYLNDEHSVAAAVDYVLHRQ